MTTARTTPGIRALQSQLAEAQAEIERLRQEVADLRFRLGLERDEEPGFVAAHRERKKDAEKLLDG